MSKHNTASIVAPEPVTNHFLTGDFGSAARETTTSDLSVVGQIPRQRIGRDRLGPANNTDCPFDLAPLYD
jgi:hypothetical protein